MKHLFYRKGVKEKWHWQKECSNFPHKDIKEMSFFFNKNGNDFCEECMKLDELHQAERIRTTEAVI